jgi:hypothetical protein
MILKKMGFKGKEMAIISNTIKPIVLMHAPVALYIIQTLLDVIA